MLSEKKPLKNVFDLQKLGYGGAPMLCTNKKPSCIRYYCIFNYNQVMQDVATLRWY